MAEAVTPMENGRIITRNLYLRTIRKLQREGRKVRNVDVARELGYSRPSVTMAMKRLRSDGLVAEGGDGGICLTERGSEAAERSEARMTVLAEGFRRLGAGETEAEDNAGRIEHLISDELYAALLRGTAGQET